MLRTALATTFVLALAAPAIVSAQPAGGAARPAPVMAAKDPKAAPAGVYKLDESHVGVIARVAHANGTSISIYRFDKAHGTVTWDPANEAATKIDITVEPGSIATNVTAPGFVARLVGPQMLKSDVYPTAEFVSTGARLISPTHAMVDGNLTFMGQTHPATADVELVGIAKGFGGKINMGASATLKFKRSDFGYTAMIGPIGDEITVMIDAEFDGQ